MQADAKLALPAPRLEVGDFLRNVAGGCEDERPRQLGGGYSPPTSTGILWRVQAETSMCGMPRPV